MRTNGRDAINLYSEMITRWFVLERDGKLIKSDVEPDPVAMGVDAWAAEKIRERVRKEVFRKI